MADPAPGDRGAEAAHAVGSSSHLIAHGDRLPPFSSALSRISALYLGALGLALLFGADALMPRLVPGFPSNAAWVGQLLAAAWLGAAAVNWNGRANLLGGIYGRPQVSLNLLIFLVGGLSLIKADAPSLVHSVLTIPMLLFAVAYGAVMLRGPFDGLTPKP